MIEKYQSLLPHLPKFPPEFKSLRNEEKNDNPESKDNSKTDIDDMSLTDWDDFIENVKATKNTNDENKYKEDNKQHQDDNENVIKKTKKTKHLFNGWCLWISNKMSQNMW